MKSTEAFAKPLVITIYIYILFELIYLIALPISYSNLEGAYTEGGASFELMKTINTIIGSVDSLFTLTSMILFVLLIAWVRRTYQNLHLKAKYLNSNVNWAIWSFIIPFVNFVAPRNLLVEIHEESEKLLKDNGIPFQWSIAISFVTIWWTIAIVYRIFSRIVDKVFSAPLGMEEYQTFVILYMIGSALGITFGFMSLKLIKSYKEAEVLLNQVPDFDEGSDESEEGSQDTPIALKPS